MTSWSSNLLKPADGPDEEVAFEGVLGDGDGVAHEDGEGVEDGGVWSGHEQRSFGPIGLKQKICSYTWNVIITLVYHKAVIVVCLRGQRQTVFLTSN